MHKQSTYEAFKKQMEAKLPPALKEEERLRAVAESIMSGVPYRTVETVVGKATGRAVPPHLKKALDEAWDAVTKHELGVVNAIKGDIQNAEKVIAIIERANYDIGEIKFRHKIEAL